MNIRILEGVEGAQQAAGIVVVIDVLRAATVSAHLLAQGVVSILPVATKEEAFALKQQNPDLLLVGEEEGIKIPGFELGNSPSEIRARTDLSGKRAVHRSSAGTQGLVNVTQAKEIIFGSFVTSSAILRHIERSQPDEVCFVPMYALEDQLFAEYMQSRLLGRAPLSIERIREQLEQQDSIRRRFLNPENHNFPAEDFYLALTLDAFDFFPVLRDGVLVMVTSLA